MYDAAHQKIRVRHTSLAVAGSREPVDNVSVHPIADPEGEDAGVAGPRADQIEGFTLDCHCNSAPMW